LVKTGHDPCTFRKGRHAEEIVQMLHVTPNINRIGRLVQKMMDNQAITFEVYFILCDTGMTEQIHNPKEFAMEHINIKGLTQNNLKNISPLMKY